MGDAVTSALDHLFAAAMLVVFVGFGVAACVLGVVMLTRARSLRLRWNHELRWQLISWGVVPWWASAPGVELDVRRTSRRLGAYAAIGAGLGTLAGMAAVTMGSLVATGDLLALPALSVSLFGGGIFFGFLVGSATGYTLGIWRLKRAADRLAYADLRRPAPPSARGLSRRLAVLASGCHDRGRGGSNCAHRSPPGSVAARQTG